MRQSYVRWFVLVSVPFLFLSTAHAWSLFKTTPKTKVSVQETTRTAVTGDQILPIPKAQVPEGMQPSDRPSLGSVPTYTEKGTVNSIGNVVNVWEVPCLDRIHGVDGRKSAVHPPKIEAASMDTIMQQNAGLLFCNILTDAWKARKEVVIEGVAEAITDLGVQHASISSLERFADPNVTVFEISNVPQEPNRTTPGTVVQSKAQFSNNQLECSAIVDIGDQFIALELKAPSTYDQMSDLQKMRVSNNIAASCHILFSALDSARKITFRRPTSEEERVFIQSY